MTSLEEHLKPGPGERETTRGMILANERVIYRACAAVMIADARRPGNDKEEDEVIQQIRMLADEAGIPRDVFAARFAGDAANLALERNGVILRSARTNSEQHAKEWMAGGAKVHDA